MSGRRFFRFPHFLELFLSHRLTLQRRQLRYPVDKGARGSDHWVRIGLDCMARDRRRESNGRETKRKIRMRYTENEKYSIRDIICTLKLEHTVEIRPHTPPDNTEHSLSPCDPLFHFMNHATCSRREKSMKMTRFNIIDTCRGWILLFTCYTDVSRPQKNTQDKPCTSKVLASQSKHQNNSLF